MKLLYTIIGMLVILFVITFSLKNTNPVHLLYYDVIDVNVPSYMLIFISFGVGVVFTGLLDFFERMRLVRKASRLNRRIKVLEKEAKKKPGETEVLPPESEEASTL